MEEELINPDVDLWDLVLEDIPEPVFRSSFGVYYEHDILKLLKSNNPNDTIELNQLLTEIITANNIRAFEFLMLNGYKIDIINQKNQTCIHLAYYASSWDILSSYDLWSPNLSGDMITCTDKNGLNFLHIACYIANTEFAERCLKSNLDFKARFYPNSEQIHHKEFTALHFAALNHNLSIVKQLLSHNVDVNATDYLGRTSLHIACCTYSNSGTQLFEDRLSIMNLLLQNHCNPNLEDVHGNISLFSIFPDNYNTFTHNSDIVNSVPIIETKMKLELLLKQDVDFTIKNINDETILHCIIKNLHHLRLPSNSANISFDDTNHVEMLQKILYTNPNIKLNEKNIKGQTPLQLAVSYMSIAIVEILLQSGADVNTVKFDVINNNYCFYYPFIVPNLESIINIELIIRLLTQKQFKITIEENLNILRFLVHDIENCECLKLGSVDESNNYFIKIINCGLLHNGIQKYMHIFENNPEKCITLLGCLGKHALVKKFCKFYCSPIYNQILSAIGQLSEVKVQDYVSDNIADEMIALLKSTSLRDDVTLYDVMVKHPQCVHMYLKDIETYSLILNITNRYENNGIRDIIQGHVAYSLMRDYVVRSAFDYFEILFPFLPEPCCKIILHYLDEKSILNTCLAAVIESN